MIDWFAQIKKFYDRKLWTKAMVGDAVWVGKITPEQYKEITGEDYVEGPAPYVEAPQV